MKIRERLEEMATRARLKNVLISVLDARMITAGIPEEITDEYIYFGNETWEIGRTGTLGGDPVEAEKIAPGGKMILLSSVISVDFIRRPK